MTHRHKEKGGQSAYRHGRLEVVRPGSNATTAQTTFNWPSPRILWTIVKEAVKGWKEDRAASMGAALAYYVAFSIAPLLIVIVAVAGLVFGRDAAQAALIGQLQELLGAGAGEAINDMLVRASDLGTGVLGIAVGVGGLLLATTTAFVELQDDLDRIWKAEPRVGSGIWNLLRSRLVSFAMVLFIGFLLTISLALSAALAALGNHMFSNFEFLLQAINFVASLAVITVLFAMVYKFLPNVDIAWRDVWVGAAITSLLFGVGKLLIGLYIGKSSVASSFGAAGPFVVILLWLYYSTQIFLLGAEFAAKYARARRPAQQESGARSSVEQRRPRATSNPKAPASEAFLVSAQRPDNLDSPAHP
jgi:membrane protein